MATDLTNLDLALQFAVRATAYKTNANGLGEATDLFSLDLAPSAFVFGTGSGKANQVWRDRRTLAGGASDALDLRGGSLTNGFGVTASFSKIKLIAIFNRSHLQTPATTASILVGGGSNPFLGQNNDQIATVEAGCPCLQLSTEGWTVTAETGDILLIDNDEAEDGAQYDIVIIGEAA